MGETVAVTITLELPDVRFHRSWVDMYGEFGDGAMDGSGYLYGVDHDLSVHAMTHVVIDRRAQALPDAPRPEGHVPCTFRWIAEGEELLGFIAIRHALNDFLLEQGGHIGYAVRPSRRREGVATEALRQALPLAAELGLDRVLVTCDEDNVASRATIERCGGVYEDSRAGKRRYWIA